MSSQKNEIPPPPIFSEPLFKISTTNSIDDPIITHDNQCKAGDWITSLCRRHSSRKRDFQNLYDRKVMEKGMNKWG